MEKKHSISRYFAHIVGKILKKPANQQPPCNGLAAVTVKHRVGSLGREGSPGRTGSPGREEGDLALVLSLSMNWDTLWLVRAAKTLYRSHYVLHKSLHSAL